MASFLPVLAMLTAAYGGQFDFSQQPQTRLHTLSVSGTAVAYVKPDYATIDVGAFAKDASAVAAKRRCDAAMSKAIAAIRARGVRPEDIETSDYSIFPVRAHESDPLTWKVQETATIKVRDLEKVATVIDTAVTNGAPQVSNIQFGLESVASARAKARGSAVKMATEKASALAKLAGVQLGEVLSIAEDNAEVMRYQTMAANTASFDFAGSPGTISAGRQSISLTVSMVFAIR